MKTVIMLLSNSFEPDIRVLKECVTLIKNNYLVEVVCWDREAKLKKIEYLKGIKITRIQLAAAYGKGITSILKYVKFYIYMFVILIKRKIDILHCHDFEMFIFGCLISIIKKCSLIYDAHEVEYFVHLPEMYRKLVSRIEKVIIKKADLIIAVNKIQMVKYQRILPGSKKIIELRNYPNKVFLNKKRIIKNKEKIVIGFVGYIQDKMGFERFINIFNKLIVRYQNIQFLIIGKIHPIYSKSFNQLIERNNNIKIKKYIKYYELNKYYNQIDISIMLYDNIPKYMSSTPTKLFESMAQSIPVIATPIGDVKNIVNKHKCGYIVSFENDEELEKKLLKLIDNKLIRRTIGMRGYLAAQKYYIWEKQENKLIEAYNHI